MGPEPECLKLPYCGNFVEADPPPPSHSKVHSCKSLPSILDIMQLLLSLSVLGNKMIRRAKLVCTQSCPVDKGLCHTRTDSDGL
jgi:hypothetical protein